MQIQKDNIWLQFFDHFPGLRDVAGFAATKEVALLIKPLNDARAKKRVVIDNKDADFMVAHDIAGNGAASDSIGTLQVRRDFPSGLRVAEISPPRVSAR